MRGKITYKILDFIKDRSMDSINFAKAFLNAGYGATFGKMEYERDILNRKSEIYKISRENKRRLQVYLSRLKSDGLILESSKNKMKLSIKGKKKLNILRQNRVLDKNLYKKEQGGRAIIISYDIPTPFNRERDILRGILKALGFTMIHKSVWAGKVKLPSDFISALGQLKINDFVEIMEITKNGSIKSIPA